MKATEEYSKTKPPFGRAKSCSLKPGDIGYSRELYPTFFDPFIVLESLGYDLWDYEIIRIRYWHGEEKTTRSYGFNNAKEIMQKAEEFLEKYKQLTIVTK